MTVLRVPLDRDDVGALVFAGLDESVVGHGGDRQTDSKPIDGLVVIGRYIDDLRAHYGVEPRAAHHPDLMNSIVVPYFRRGHVLCEAAAQCDVENLHTRQIAKVGIASSITDRVTPRSNPSWKATVSRVCGAGSAP